ncbi:MAG: SGNH/GDSL hydrolase family protein, partial [Calditrichaeota bacterium]
MTIMSKALTPKQKAAIQKQYLTKTPQQLAREYGVAEEAVVAFVQALKKQKARRERVFKWLLPLVSIGFLLLVELSLRLFHYAEDRPLFVTADFDARYWIVNPSVGQRYFLQKAVTPITAFDFFLKHKPANAYRIFVLGGSSAAGYPYLYNGTFPRMLKTRLQDAYPQKLIEVVNLAMPAVNSFTLLDFMRELPDYQPDLILIYAGHNEFYGALGVGSSESLGEHR